jgi:hypothetical protein
MEPRKIYIFYHVGALKNWRAIVDEQMKALKDSGLYDRITTMYIGFSGPESEILKAYITDEKVQFFDSDPLIPNENQTFNFMIKTCKTLEDANILFLHTKGVTEKNDIQSQWRQYMMAINVERFEKCLKILEDFYTVGAIFLWRPRPHYSGNFFWARSSYVAELPLITDFKNRYLAESHLLSKMHKGSHVSIGNSWYCFRLGPFGINRASFAKIDETTRVV